MMRVSSVALVSLLCLLAVRVQPAGAAFLTHNGARVSNPPGTGEVDVLLQDSVPGSFVQFDILKEFGEIATHEANVAFFAFDIPASETVINLSDDPWGEFRIDLESVSPIQFLGSDLTPVPLVNPVGPGNIEFAAFGGVTVESSFIEQTSDTLASLLIDFGNAVDPGEGFILSFGIHHDTIPSEPAFIIRESPVFGESTPVPEPGGLALALIGAVGIFNFRRRIRQRGAS